MSRIDEGDGAGDRPFDGGLAFGVCGGFGVIDLGFAGRQMPRLSRSLGGGLAGEEGEHFLVWIGAGQGDGDA